MITHAASRKHYYTVLLDRPESPFLFCDQTTVLGFNESV